LAAYSRFPVVACKRCWTSYKSRIDRRYSIFPVEYLIEPRPLEQISREYREHSFVWAAVLLSRHWTRLASCRKTWT
jgi:hypothetical protein